MLFSYTDVQPRLNIDLSNPNGQDLAATLIKAAQSWASRVLDFPIEEAEVTEYFSQGDNRLWLNTSAPVSDVTVSTYNNVEGDYGAIESRYARNAGDHNLYVSIPLPSGFQSVKVTYSTGWTAQTVPDELKDALIELVGLKIQEVANFSSNPDDPQGDGSGVATGALKRVQSGSVTLEYALTSNETAWKAKAKQLARSIGDDVPTHIRETVESYRRPFAV